MGEFVQDTREFHLYFRKMTVGSCPEDEFNGVGGCNEKLGVGVVF